MNYYKPKSFSKYIGKKFKYKTPDLRGNIRTFKVTDIRRGDGPETNSIYFIFHGTGCIGPFRKAMSVTWFFNNKVDEV